MESGRRTTPTVSTSSSFSYRGHTKLLYAVSVNMQQGSTSEVKTVEERCEFSSPLRFYSPLVNIMTQICVGLLLESVITPVQGQYILNFLHQWEF